MLRAYADGALFGVSHGEGPARVLLLHGWGRRAADFDDVGARLAAAGLASVALDLPGFGATPAPARPGGARHYADLVAPVLAELDAPVVLVGHSLGGRVAAVLAARGGDGVAGVALVAAPLLRLGAPARPARGFRAARWLHRRHLLSDAAMESARQRHGAADYRAATGVMRAVNVAMVAEEYGEELDAIVAPVRLVWGELDREVPVAVGRAALERLGARASLDVVPGVGHLVPTEAPGAVAAAAEALSR